MLDSVVGGFSERRRKAPPHTKSFSETAPDRAGLENATVFVVEDARLAIATLSAAYRAL
jgi:hypothetical protein